MCAVTCREPMTNSLIISALNVLSFSNHMMEFMAMQRQKKCQTSSFMCTNGNLCFKTCHCTATQIKTSDGLNREMIVYSFSYSFALPFASVFATIFSLISCQKCWLKCGLKLSKVLQVFVPLMCQWFWYTRRWVPNIEGSREPLRNPHAEPLQCMLCTENNNVPAI